MPARSPDYKLTLSPKKTEGGKRRYYHRIGVAWEDDSNGSIAIQLAPGTTITHELLETHYLTLWPAGSPPGKLEAGSDVEPNEPPP